MSMDDMIDLGKACGRKLSEAEAARLREVGNRLNLREDDALWPLLAAMEYQRVYYEALPKEIAAASKTIMDGIAAAAEKETAAAQARAHRQRGEGSAKSCLENSIRQAGVDGVAGPDLPAGLRKPDALGGLPYRHRQEYSSGGNSAHALRLAHQRAVSRGRVILRRFERKELRRRKKGDMETRNLGTITYFYRMQHVCLFNNILK